MGAPDAPVAAGPEAPAEQCELAGASEKRLGYELSGASGGDQSGSITCDGKGALRAAQALRASMPAAVKKYLGNMEGYEWWERHEALFEEARLQWGMLDPSVYRLIPGPDADEWQRPVGAEAPAVDGCDAPDAGFCDIAIRGQSHEADGGVAADEDGIPAGWPHPLRRSPLAEAIWLRAEVRHALAQGTPEALRAVLDEVCCDSAGHRVYALDLLEEEFCDRLLAELDHIELSGIPLRRPNGMNRFGAILSNLGFQEGLLTPLMQHVVLPFANSLWPEWVDRSDCDETYGFVVRYRIGEDVDLAEHADTSNVTLNVCLGREFEGGDLYFKGVRFTDSEDDKDPLPPFLHRKGRAAIHLGGHFHGVLPITSGERSNLVLWAMGQYGVVRIRPRTPR